MWVHWPACGAVHADVQESIAIGTGTIRKGTSVVYHLNIPVIRHIDIWSNRLSRWLMVIAAVWAFLLAFYILAAIYVATNPTSCAHNRFAVRGPKPSGN